jgi:tetratricopeptide (TPR) repeat protein
MPQQFFAVFIALTLFGLVPAGPQPVVDQARAKEALSHYRAGDEFLHAEQFEKAAAEFSTAIKLDPLLTLAHYGLGQSYMGMKSYRQAIDAFIGCRDAYRQISAMQMSDKISADQRRDDEVRELKDSLRRLESGQIKGNNRATILRIESQIREVENSKQRGMQSFDAPAGVFLALGSAYFRSGSLEDAEREYRQAIKVNSKLGEAHNNLAVVCMMTNRFGEAEEEIKLAEKAGYRVNPQFKEDLKNRKKQGTE